MTKRNNVTVEHVTANIIANRPVFAIDALGNSGLLDQCVPGLSELQLDSSTFQKDEASLTASGTFNVFSLGELPTTLRMRESNDEWYCTVRTRLAPETVSLGFVKSASIDTAEFSAELSGLDNDLFQADRKLSLICTLGTRSYPITVSSPSHDLHVQISHQRVDLGQLAVLVQQFDCGGVLERLPLDSVEGELDIVEFALVVDGSTGRPRRIDLALSLKEIPLAVSGLVLRDVSLAIGASGFGAGASPQVSVLVSAQLVMGSTSVYLSGRAPAYRFKGSLQTKDGIPLSSLFAMIDSDSLAFDVPELSIMSMNADLDLGAPRLRLQSDVEGHWQIPGTDSELRQLSFSLELSKTNPKVSCSALTDVRGTPVVVYGELGRDIEFSGSFEPTTLSGLLNRLGLELPPAVPDVHIKRTDVVISGEQKTVHVSTGASLSHDFFATGTPVDIAMSVAIDMPSGGDLTARISLDASGHTPISDDLTIQGLGLEFGLTEGGAWFASGHCKGVFFDKACTLVAAYQHDESATVLTLTADTRIALTGVADGASVVFSSLSVAVSTANKRRHVSVLGTALLAVERFFEYDALFVAAKDGLRLRPNPAASERQVVSIPLALRPNGSDSPSVQMELLEVALTRVSKGPKISWTMAGDAQVAIQNMPEPANWVFKSESARGSLRVDEQGCSIRIDPPEGLTIDLSLQSGKKARLPLPVLEVGSYFLQRRRAKRASTWELGAAITASRVDRLNTVLGGVELFRDTVDIELLVNKGLSARVTSSPFKQLRVRTLDDGSVWTIWRLFKGVGRLSFQVPEFAFDFGGGRWRASGGFMTKGSISLPLAPLKWLAAKCGVPVKAVKRMPDGLPLREVNIASPAYVDEALKQLGPQSKTVEKAFRQFAKVIQSGAENFPDEFSEYLSIHIPKELRFDVAVEPGGGAHVALSVVDDKPLKVVFPSVVGVPPLPSLVGVSLFNIGFGATGGGSIGVLKFDGWLDRVDLLNLGYALTTGKGKDIANRFTMRKLVALIPMAVPVPIPLFYDTLSWRYRNALGLGMELKAAFPDPEPSVVDWIELMMSLGKFFSRGDHYLHQKGNLPDGLSLPFTLGPARLSLPTYLGGAQIGFDKSLPKLPVEDTLARAIDGIKAGNAGWVIESIPLNFKRGKTTHWSRIANIGMEFGPLSFAAIACVTTDAEFRGKVMKSKAASKMLSDAEPEEMLGCTPASMGGRPFDKGFLILCMGRAAVRAGKVDFFRYKAQFGMALTGPGQFQVAIKKSIRFGPDGFLAIETAGLIKTRQLPNQPGRVSVTIDGDLSLLVFNKRYALGSTLKVIPGEMFEASVRLTLASDFVLLGKLRISKQSASIAGKLTWDMPGKAEVRIGCTASISKDGIYVEPVSVKLGGLTTRLHLILPGKRKSLFSAGFEVQLPPGFTHEFRKGLKSTANKVVGKEVKDGYSQLLSAIATQESYEISLSGIRTWLPVTCNEALKSVERATTKKAVLQALDHWANQPKSKVKKLGRKTLAGLVKPFAPKEIREAAAPWKTKLRAVRNAANAKVDKNYKKNLQNAIAKLIKDNAVKIRIGEFKKFPGLTIYTHSPVLSKQQIKLVNQAIAAIGKLPKATKQRVAAERVLASMPRNQQVMADVKNSISQGVDAGIPSIRSVRFEKSVRPLSLGDVTLRVECMYKGKARVFNLQADVTKAKSLPKQIAQAFSKAF